MLGKTAELDRQNLLPVGLSNGRQIRPAVNHGLPSPVRTIVSGALHLSAGPQASRLLRIPSTDRANFAEIDGCRFE
jgi:hypothetical protein